MTPFHRATAATVTLTRPQVESILLNWMGWEAEDVITFWRAALREARDPGCIDRALRAKIERLIKRVCKD
jgi:transposase InsO family protein